MAEAALPGFRYDRPRCRPMGSSKKPKKRKVEAADGPAAHDDAGARASERDPLDSIAGLCVSVEDLGRRLDLLERRLERALLLQERTNTLLELLAGSAFDMELDGPPRQ